MMNNTTLGYKGTSSVSPQDGQYDRTVAERSIIAFLVGIIGVLAFVGNITVIACIRVYRRLRVEVGSNFIVNLCLADSFTSLLVMSSSFYNVLADVTTVHKRYCQFVCCMNYTLIIVSMLTLSFIALDRYLAVVYALRYHSLMKKRVAMLLISWSWFQGLLFGLAPVFQDWIQYDYWEIVCAIHWVGAGPLLYVIIAFIVCFLMPGLVLAVLYCKVMSVAKVQLKSQNLNLGRLDQEGIHKVSSATFDTSTNTTKPESLPNGDNRNSSDFHVHDNNSHFQNQQSGHQSSQNNTLKFSGYQNSSNGDKQNNGSVKPFPTSKGENISENESKKELTFDQKGATAFSLSPSPPALATSFISSVSLSNSQQTTHSRPVPITAIIASTVDQISGNGVKSTSVDHVEVMPNNQQQAPRSASSGIPSATKCFGKKDQAVKYSASRKALRSLLIVVLAFFICMTPFSVTKLYKVIRSDSHALPGYINVFATLAQYISSAINPLVYGILRKDFQTAFKLLLRKVRRTAGDLDSSISAMT